VIDHGRAARRRPRRRPVWRRPAAGIVLGLAVAVLLLLVGISVGRALEDGPAPGGTRTDVRTLDPQPLPPAGRTVTVTVTE
jgi:ABC-type Fe3+ transport system permease subunit